MTIARKVKSPLKTFNQDKCVLYQIRMPSPEINYFSDNSRINHGVYLLSSKQPIVSEHFFRLCAYTTIRSLNNQVHQAADLRNELQNFFSFIPIALQMIQNLST